MARKITMFELHFDGARFGPSFGEKPTAGDGGTVADDTPDPSGSRARLVVAMIALATVGTLVGRRVVRRFRDEPELDVDESDVVETAAEQ